MRPFTYLRHEDLTTLPEGAKFLAGGTTLIDLMKLNVETPSAVLDLAGLDRPGLREIIAGENGIRIGALVSMADAADHSLIAENYPLVVKRNPGSGCSALEGVNRMHAILGTSDDCVATYPGDFAQALIALGGHVETTGTAGTRRIPFEDLHRPVTDGPHRETVLRHEEIITAIVLPPGNYRRSLYLKVRDRESYEFAVASAAVALKLDDRGRVDDARIALGGVAYRPWRAREAEQSLIGGELTEHDAVAASERAFAEARPLHHNQFKVMLGRETLIEALLRAKSLEI
jgi:xanthine dehydrogenase YagS FAD-binding subunit